MIQLLVHELMTLGTEAGAHQRLLQALARTAPPSASMAPVAADPPVEWTDSPRHGPTREDDMALSFGLDDAVLADFPESQVRLVLADGVRNDGSWPLTDRLIDE